MSVGHLTASSREAEGVIDTGCTHQEGAGGYYCLVIGLSGLWLPEATITTGGWKSRILHCSVLNKLQCQCQFYPWPHSHDSKKVLVSVSLLCLDSSEQDMFSPPTICSETVCLRI